jgi:GrpB-like predicted nucleotidyltransferase (UPF0157 family)
MKTSKALQQRIQKAVSEKVDIVSYDPIWLKLFKDEEEFLNTNFPEIIKRIEHFGSTAIPGISAKPIVDMLIEVTSLKETKKFIVPVLKSLGYDYFWRPEIDKPPMYAWFIKRNSAGNRTHHLHMVEANSKLWERLYFRDYLREHQEAAEQYETIKTELSQKFPNDREAYTKAKTEFISSVTEKAKEYYKKLK